MANEARLNLVISAQDQAKTVIEEMINNIKTAFDGLKNLTTDFNMDGMTQPLQSVAEAAMTTRTSLEESINGMKSSADTLSATMTESADKSTQAFMSLEETLKTASDQIAQSLDSVGQSAKHMDESLDFMNLQMAGEMIQHVGEQITGFFEHAVASAADFDQNIVNTTASLDANMGTMKLNTQQIQTMQQAAIDMGNSGFFSANQVADAMNTMAKQGIDYQQIMSGGIQTVYKVAAANQSDLESTANVVSDIYNEMGDMFKRTGMSAQDASQLIGNSMTVALHHARISMEDFMTTMKYVGPQAAAMNVGIKDVSAAIALLGEHGIRSSQAGTTLRRMLTNLQPASQAAGHWMHQLGMLTKDNANIFYDAAGNMKPLTEVQQILYDKLHTLNPEMQQQAIKAIFGQYALSGMTAIVNTAPSKYQALTAAMNNNNVMTDIMAEKSQGLGMQLQMLNAHWQTIQKTIGEALKPIVEVLIGSLNSLMEAWQNLNPHVKQFIIITAAVTGVVLLVGGALLALIGTIGMFATAWGAGIAVLSAIAAPILAVIGVIVAVGVAIAGLAYAWDRNLGGIKDKTMEAVNYVKNLFNNLKAAFTDLWSGTGGKGISILERLGFSSSAVGAIQNAISRIKEGIAGLKQGFDIAKKAVEGIIMVVSGIGGGKGIDILQKLGFSKSTINTLMQMGGQIKAIMQGIQTTFNTTISNISNFVRPTISSLLDFWNSHQYQFRQTIETVWNAIGNALRVAMSFMINTIGPALSTVFNWWNEYWPEMQSAFQTVWRAIIAILSPAIILITTTIVAGLGFIKGAWSDGWRAIGDVLKAAWDLSTGIIRTAWGIISGIISVALDLLSGNFRKAGSDFVSTLKNAFSNITSLFSNLAQDAFNFGANFVHMLANGITGAVGAVTSAVSGVADKIKGFLGFHSPTREGPASESDVWAPNFVNMMAKGIQEHTPQIQAAVNGIALSMKTGVSSVNHNISTNQISVPANRTNSTQPNINIYIDGRSAKTDNDLAEIIAHKIYRQMPVVS